MKVQNLVRLKGCLLLERISERAWAWKKKVIRFCLLEIDCHLKGLRLSTNRPLDGVSVTKINDILAQNETEHGEKAKQHFHIWFIINSALSKKAKITSILFFYKINPATKPTNHLYSNHFAAFFWRDFRTFASRDMFSSAVGSVKM